MAGTASGYDLSSSTFSPEGRLFQVEYAGKAVENSGTAIGLRCKDGVILAVEKIVLSKLLVPGANKRIGSADLHVGIASAGLLADGQHIVQRAQEEANNYRDNYRSPAPVKVLADRLGLYCQAYTLYSSVRPFGLSTLIAGVDQAYGPSLYCIEPSGIYWGYRGCAIGKGRQLAKTEIEKLDLANLTCREALAKAATIIHKVHDDTKDKAFELEMTWICPESKNKHAHVPKELLDEAEAAAKADLEEEMED